MASHSGPPLKATNTFYRVRSILLIKATSPSSTILGTTIAFFMSDSSTPRMVSNSRSMLSDFFSTVAARSLATKSQQGWGANRARLGFEAGAPNSVPPRIEPCGPQCTQS